MTSDKIVRIALFRYKRGRQEYRTVNVPDATPQEVVKMIIMIIDSDPSISVIHDATVKVTGIWVQLRERNKRTGHLNLTGKTHRLAFKGLSPTDTQALLLLHIPNSFHNEIKKKS